jgi:hypothetical protein
MMLSSSLDNTGLMVTILAKDDAHRSVLRKTGRAKKERWLSGRKRRFAKPVSGETLTAGSNPVLSVKCQMHWGMLR